MSADLPALWSVYAYSTLCIAARLIPIALLLPCLGAGLTPPGVRLFFGSAAAALVVAGLSASMLLSPSSHDVSLQDSVPWTELQRAASLGTWRLALVLARELLLGVVIGFTLALVFVAAQAGFYLAAQAIGDYRFSQVSQTGEQSMPTLGVLVSLVVFFAVDGHLVLVRALARSYQVLPPPATPWLAAPPTKGLSLGLVHVTGHVIEVALAVAAPVLLATALTRLALGLVQRIHSGMQTAGFAVVIGRLVGLAMLALSLTAVAAYLAAELRALPDLLDLLVG